MDVLAGAGGYLSAEEVCERVRTACPGVGIATVYRTLNVLVELGLACEIPGAGSSRSYAVGSETHHHHITCTGCGAVAEFSTSGLDEIQQRLELETGFSIESHILEFSGVCPRCRGDGN